MSVWVQALKPPPPTPPVMALTLRQIVPIVHQKNIMKHGFYQVIVIRIGTCISVLVSNTF